MSKLTVKVKRKHIKTVRDNLDNGLYYDAYSCPVALALNEACPNYAFGVYAGGSRQIRISPRDESYNGPQLNAEQPDSVARFVSMFDSHMWTALFPFQFTIEVPDEVVCAK